jgi:hypothetical protein
MEIMGKHEGAYDLCPNCGYLQARDPFWLVESYKKPITQTDIGSINRCVTNAGITQLLITFCIRSVGPFLDYGAGYGMFVRHMRDLGYDFWYQDSYCQNLFADDFVASLDTERTFALVTAFEVFEHMPNPLDDLNRILRCGRGILFTTELLPQPMPAMGKWWYHAPDHGQHIGFFSLRTLQHLADKFSLNLATNGTNIHYLGKNRVSSTSMRLLSHPRSRALLRFCRRESLLMADFDARREKTFKALGLPPPR